MIILLMTVFLGVKQPQMLVLPLILFIYLSRGLIRRVLKPVNLPLVYILTGWILGMCVEIFAIWQNMKLPIGERKLFNQDPLLDLIIGAGFYLVVSIVLYYFVARYKFTKKSFIGITSFYAIVVEQLGIVFIAGFINPFLWVYVTLIYCTWTVTPYLLFHERFPERLSPSLKIYPIILIALWLASFLGSIVGTLMSKMV